jgi:hypothetical protein
LDIVDYVPVNQKIKKKILIDGEWQEQVFIQVDTSSNLAKFLVEKYPNSGYLKDWWQTGNRVTMSDKVYVHWKLCS